MTGLTKIGQIPGRKGCDFGPSGGYTSLSGMRRGDALLTLNFDSAYSRVFFSENRLSMFDMTNLVIEITK